MKNDRNAMNHFDFMDSYSLAVLIQILTTLPVTIATNNRSFSALKYLKTFAKYNQGNAFKWPCIAVCSP